MNDTYEGSGLGRLGYKGMGDFLSRNKAPIIISFLVCFSALVLFSYFLVPTTYTAKASIVVGKPQFQSLFGVFSVVPQDPRIAAPSIILQSDAFAEKIVSKLRLQLEEGKRLSDRVSISTNNSGLITIKARGNSPEESASIANAYVDELGAEVKGILAAMLADKKFRLESLRKGMQKDVAGLGSKGTEVTLASSLIELAMLDIGVAATSEFVHIVDHAKAAEAKATPQRLRWVAVSAIFALVFSMILAAYLGYRKCPVAA